MTIYKDRIELSDAALREMLLFDSVAEGELLRPDSHGRRLPSVQTLEYVDVSSGDYYDPSDMVCLDEDEPTEIPDHGSRIGEFALSRGAYPDLPVDTLPRDFLWLYARGRSPIDCFNY